MPTYDVYLGVDVGKYHHYAYAMNADGTLLFHTPVKQCCADLIALCEQAKTHGTVLLVVDQPNNIGRLVVQTARQQQCDVKYMPGLAMRNLAKTYQGNTKNDRKDAYIIADGARTRPDVLLDVDRIDEVYAKLKSLNGLDDDLKRQYTQCANRLRAALLNSYPEFEAALKGQLLHAFWMLEMLLHYNSPASMKHAGHKRLTRFATKHGARNPDQKITALLDAINRQTVAMPAQQEHWYSVQTHAGTMLRLARNRQEIQQRVIALAKTVPEYEIIRSVPGMGERSTAIFLMCVGDLSAFHTPAALASYAGLSPQQRQSGVSIRSSSPNRGGNKKLKNALWMSAFASLNHHQRSKSYYDRKRRQGKRHNAAVVCLARRRCNVLFAMIKNATLYQEKIPTPACGPSQAT